MSSSHADGPRLIYEEARECERLFSDSISKARNCFKENPTLSHIEKQQQRFYICCSHVGILAKIHKASLDSRLKSFEDIQSIVIQLLRTLQRNLLYVVDNISDDQKYTVDDALNSIDEALDKFIRLVVLIREASTHSRIHRADAAQLQREDLDFGNFAYNAVRFQFPKISSVFAKLLSRTVVIRRKRLRDQQRQHFILSDGETREASQKLETVADREQKSPGAKEERQQPRNLTAAVSSSATTRKDVPKQVKFAPMAPSAAKASTIDPELFKRRYQAPTRTSSRISLAQSTVDGDDGYYPERPRFTSGAKEVLCDYCFEPLDTIKLQDYGFWRSHFDRDFQPYVCISEKHQTAPFFASAASWSTHMELEHSDRWTSQINLPVKWVCNVEHDEDWIFDSEWSYLNHVETEHQDYDEAERKIMRETSEIPEPRIPYACPLCDCIPLDIIEKISPNGIAGLENLEELDAATVVALLKQQNISDVDPILLAELTNHIACHLRNIACRSLAHFRKNDEEGDGDQGSQSVPTTEAVNSSQSQIEPDEMELELLQQSNSFQDNEIMEGLTQAHLIALSSDSWPSDTAFAKSKSNVAILEWSFIPPRDYNIDDDQMIFTLYIQQSFQESSPLSNVQGGWPGPRNNQFQDRLELSEPKSIIPKRTRVLSSLPEDQIKVLYRPLNSETKEFRLLRVTVSSSVLPGFDNPIAFNLFRQTFDAVELPSYTVISYLWHVEGLSSMRQLTVDNIIMHIYPNIHAALGQIINDFRSCILWVDQICINQQDQNERGHQVGFMHNIFRKADRNICWLGTAEPDTAAAFQLLRFLLSVSKKATGNDNSAKENTRESRRLARKLEARLKLDKRGQKGLEKIIASPCFRRIWIFFEMSISKTLVVYCGPFKMGWKDFSRSLRGLYVLSKDLKVDMSIEQIETILQLDLLRQIMLEKSQIYLHEIMDFFRHLSGADHRDKVFAAWSLWREISNSQHLSKERMSTNYSLHVVQIFIKSAELIILDMEKICPYINLSLAGGSRCYIQPIEASYTDRHLLPSWVPNWIDRSQLYLFNSPESFFKCSPLPQESVKFLPTDKIQFHGTTIDVLSHVFKSITDSENLVRMEELSNIGHIFGLISWLNSASRATQLESETTSLLLRFLETVQAYGCDLWTSREPRRLHQDLLLRIFSRTGVSFSPQQEIPPPASVEYFDESISWIKKAQVGTISWSSLATRNFLVRCLPAYGRAFGVTKRGRFCLLPKQSCVGDLICVPVGSKVPFIFRKEADDVVNLGEAYIEGIMFAEYKDDAEYRLHNIETFTIGSRSIPKTETQIGTTAKIETTYVTADYWFNNLEVRTHPVVLDPTYTSFDTSSGRLYSKVRMAILDGGSSLEEEAWARVSASSVNQSEQIKVRKIPSYETLTEDEISRGTMIATLATDVCPNMEVSVVQFKKSIVNNGGLQTIAFVEFSLVAKAIEWAIEQKVDIINISIAWRYRPAVVAAAIQRAHSAGILVFAPMMRWDSADTCYPANDANVIGIYPVDGSGQLSRFSSAAHADGKLRFSAPGENINYLVARGGDGKRRSGSSLATVIAAGIAGLILEFARQKPLSLEPQISQLLQSKSGMISIFEILSKHTETNICYMMPWILFDVKDTRYLKTSEISPARMFAAAQIVHRLKLIDPRCGETIDLKLGEMQNIETTL